MHIRLRRCPGKGAARSARRTAVQAATQAAAHAEPPVQSCPCRAAHACSRPRMQRRPRMQSRPRMQGRPCSAMSSLGHQQGALLGDHSTHVVGQAALRRGGSSGSDSDRARARASPHAQLSLAPFCRPQAAPRNQHSASRASPAPPVCLAERPPARLQPAQVLQPAPTLAKLT